MSMYAVFRCLPACFCLSLALLAPVGSDANDEVGASLGFNFYPYLAQAQDDTELTLNSSVTLPAGVSYFGFINFGNVFDNGSTEFLISEQNLRWQPSRRIPMDAAIQTVVVRGEGTDSWQAGPRWRLNDTPVLRTFFDAIHASYNVSFFVVRFDSTPGDVRQISHAYALEFPYLSDRLYLSGFFDHNLHRGGRHDAVVTETQLGFRLHGSLYAIAEYRRNEYKASNADNLALGLEFRARW